MFHLLYDRRKKVFFFLPTTEGGGRGWFFQAGLANDYEVAYEVAVLFVYSQKYGFALQMSHVRLSELIYLSI